MPKCAGRRASRRLHVHLVTVRRVTQNVRRSTTGQNKLCANVGRATTKLYVRGLRICPTAQTKRLIQGGQPCISPVRVHPRQGTPATGLLEWVLPHLPVRAPCYNSVQRPPAKTVPGGLCITGQRLEKSPAYPSHSARLSITATRGKHVRGRSVQHSRQECAHSRFTVPSPRLPTYRRNTYRGCTGQS
jgi:hypothetical protein